MTTFTAIVVDNAGIIEISPLTHEFIARLSEMIGDEPKTGKKVKAKSAKPARIWTDAEKAAFHARLLRHVRRVLRMEPLLLKIFACTPSPYHILRLQGSKIVLRIEKQPSQVLLESI
jgi:hypothetical protein